MLNDRAYNDEIQYKGNCFPGTHDILIDRATWDRVQTLLGNRQQVTHALTSADDLIDCGFCDHKITGEIKTKQRKSDAREYIYYRCTKYNKPGHPRTRIKEEDFDAQVLAFFDKIRIEDDSIRDWFRAVLASKDQGFPDRNASNAFEATATTHVACRPAGPPTQPANRRSD